MRLSEPPSCPLHRRRGCQLSWHGTCLIASAVSSAAVGLGCKGTTRGCREGRWSRGASQSLIVGGNGSLALARSEVPAPQTSRQPAAPVALLSGTAPVSPPRNPLFLSWPAASFTGSEFIDLSEPPVSYRDAFGGALSIAFKARWDKLGNWSRIIDFGSGDGRYNIIVGNMGITNNLVFRVFMKNGNWRGIRADSAITLGETNEYLLTVLENGRMQIYRDGRLLAESSSFKDGLPVVAKRSHLYVGKSNWIGSPLFLGNVADLRILHGGYIEEVNNTAAPTAAPVVAQPGTTAAVASEARTSSVEDPNYQDSLDSPVGKAGGGPAPAPLPGPRAGPGYSETLHSPRGLYGGDPVTEAPTEAPAEPANSTSRVVPGVLVTPPPLEEQPTDNLRSPLGYSGYPINDGLAESELRSS